MFIRINHNVDADMYKYGVREGQQYEVGSDYQKDWNCIIDTPSGIPLIIYSDEYEIVGADGQRIGEQDAD